MDTKWTKGPWAVSKQKARRVTASGIVICNAVLRNRGGPKHKDDLKDEHEAEANAELIAAAPDLYEALRQVTEYGNVMATFEPDTHDAIVKALAKARGETA